MVSEGTALEVEQREAEEIPVSEASNEVNMAAEHGQREELRHAIADGVWDVLEKMGFGVTMGGEKGHGGVKWEKKDNGRLDRKMFTHLMNERFSGKDGGKGWLSFREDILVALGSADKKLNGGERSN